MKWYVEIVWNLLYFYIMFFIYIYFFKSSYFQKINILWSFLELFTKINNKYII